jgi:predicted transcriptional regulator
MNVAHPYRALIPSLDGDLLVELSRSEKPRSGRELARLIDRSETGARKRLERLVEQGLVKAETTPPARLYTLNREHLAAPIVEQVAGLRLAMFERLRKQIADWKTPPVHASVFGSAARGEGDERSDIDLFVVRPQSVDADDESWRSQLNELSDSVYAWTGNRLGISEAGEEGLPSLAAGRPQVVRDLLGEGVHVAGEQARRLLGKRR